MEKLFKKKTMRRIVCFLILVAPLVYMFGALFFALNGAHGNFPLGDNQITELVNRYNLNDTDFEIGNISIYSGENISGSQLRTNYIEVIGEKVEVHYFTNPNKDYYQLCYFFYDENRNYITGSLIAWENPTVTDIPSNAKYLRLRLQPSSSNVSNTDVYYVDVLFYKDGDNDVSNSDYIFGQFFAQDNWLAQIGNKVINGDDVGIPAISTLLNYLEVNAFHAGSEPYGALIYGYAIYAVNALIIYELVCIGLSIIMIPLKVTDWLEKKGDMDL